MSLLRITPRLPSLKSQTPRVCPWSGGGGVLKGIQVMGVKTPPKNMIGSSRRGGKTPPRRKACRTSLRPMVKDLYS